MDPIMRAARAFLEEAEAGWRHSPGRALPLVADPSERGEVVKALRLGEIAPESRRPLFLYEASFSEAVAYFAGLTEAIRHDYEALRKGVGEEGVTLPAFTMSSIALGPQERAALAMERVAALLGDSFEGVTVALVPEQVADADGWRESVRQLDRMGRSSRVRLAVYVPPGSPLDGALGDLGARFHLDTAELLDFLRELGQGASAGPATTSALVLSDERASAMAAAGDKSPSPETSRRLRSLVLQAAGKLAAGEPTAAAGLFEQARALRAGERLWQEEAMVLMALGGAFVAAQTPELAIESYSKAAGLAEGAEMWALACHAWFGAGGAHLLRDNHGPAAVAYREAERAAKRAEIAPLRIEALRMAGVCLLRAGDESDAMRAWQEAVDLGAELGASELLPSTFAEVAE
jgi:tetratricopeptide (TPR) repeat protein